MQINVSTSKFQKKLGGIITCDATVRVKENFYKELPLIWDMHYIKRLQGKEWEVKCVRQARQKPRWEKLSYCYQFSCKCKIVLKTKVIFITERNIPGTE